MSDKPETDKFEKAMDAWESAMNQRQFKAALKASIDTYLWGEAEGNDLEAKVALGRMHLAVTHLIDGEHRENTSGGPSCSFCGKGGSDVRLGAGPDVFICADCVGVFYEEVGLRPRKPPQ